MQRRMRYPVKLRRNGIGGEVTVSFIVTTSGYVTAAEVTTSVHPALDEEALRVITSSRYAPALLNGEPVAVRLSLPLTWKVRVH